MCNQFRFGTNFPVSEHRRDHIKDAVTINRTSQWWSAILLIEDEKTSKKSVVLYKWQLTETGWKNRQKFIVNSQKDCGKLLRALESIIERLE